MLAADPIGFCQLPVSALMINCGVEESFTIWYANEQAGSVRIATKFTPDDSEMYENVFGQYKIIIEC